MDTRTQEQILHHYNTEKRLAQFLKNADKKDRSLLYSEVYDLLFAEVPDHPQLTRKLNPEDLEKRIRVQFNILSKFLKPEGSFLEIGAGNCSLSFKVAHCVRKVFGIDVSKKVSENEYIPDNFELILLKDSSFPIGSEEIDVAYSNQLIEHLHPDDVNEQLREVHRVLKLGGLYICRTPHRFTGPHDISKYFDETATGFHLKEYTYKELRNLFVTAGFRKMQTMQGIRGRYMSLPINISLIFESLLAGLFDGKKEKIADKLPIGLFSDISILAYK